MSEGRGEGPGPSPTERAEEQLNRWGQTIGRVASMVGMRVVRVAAFAREEAEDMWAEAQDMRHRQTSGVEPGGGTGASQREAGQQQAESKQDTEPGGEVKTGDHVGAAGRKEGEPEAASGHSAEPNKEGEVIIKATGAAVSRAGESGIDLREVEGSGSGGQITEEDVRKAEGKS